MHTPPTVDELRAQLETLIEIHEYARKPYYDHNDLKGHLTSRKNEVRRQIKARLRAGTE